MTEAVLLTAGFLAGFMIGAIAVGGAILVPLLVLGGVAVHQAIAISLAAFVAPGLLGAFWAYREGFPRMMLAALTLSAAMGAGLGAFGSRFISESIVTWVIIAAALWAAALHIVPRQTVNHPRAAPALGQSSIAGWIAGAGSAMSGTSGPLVLVPLLTFLGTDLRAAIILSQGVQAPIAVAATGLNLGTGLIPAYQVSILALSLVGGMICGNCVGFRLPAAFLNRCLAVSLFVSALLMIAQQL